DGDRFRGAELPDQVQVFPFRLWPKRKHLLQWRIYFSMVPMMLPVSPIIPGLLILVNPRIKAKFNLFRTISMFGAPHPSKFSGQPVPALLPIQPAFECGSLLHADPEHLFQLIAMV